MTAVVLVIVLLTKFLAGAWIAILAMGTFFMLMQGIRRHYDNVGRGADDRGRRPGAADPGARDRAGLQGAQADDAGAGLRQGDPARTCSRRCSSTPTPTSTARILEEWDERRIDVPLKVLYSPYREIIRPIVEYARSIRDANPRGVVAVYIPEYVVGRWWEQLLHNQTALRLKGRLLFTPGVMVTSVPFQLRSSVVAKQRAERCGQPGPRRRRPSRPGAVATRTKDRSGDLH